METLEKARWATNAISLLRQCESLEDGSPAVMFIRHTDRPEIIDPTRGSGISATAEGLEAAQEFGALLPKGRRYRVYHGTAVRCRETAEKIIEGVMRTGGEAGLGGVPDFFKHHPVLDVPRFTRRVMEEGAKSAGLSWMSGRYPPTEMEPSLDFAKRAAAEVQQSLVDAPGNCFEIYISHDAWTWALLFHWFGVGLDMEGIKPLDGFVFQLEADKMVLYYRGDHRAVGYPYWWKEP